MQTSSFPLQVVAARFFRLECNHEQLFQPEYKRSNRTKGLKILRCFPHCCPEHIDRSYCGSSLSVSIRLAKRPVRDAPPQQPAPSNVLSVFARFEAVCDVSLRPGECVEVDIIKRGMQTATNLDGQWIAGVLDRPSEVAATIRAAPTDDNDSLAERHSVVFHLNGKACSRWYYDWESGANKAQRRMTHVLKAYIVERVAVDRDDTFTTVFCSYEAGAMPLYYRVLHVVSSPEFTVVSYRRARLDPRQLAHAHAAVHVARRPIPFSVRSRSHEGASPTRLQTRNPMDHRGGSKSMHDASVMLMARDRGVTAWSELESSLRVDGYETEAKRRRRMYLNDQESMHPLEDKLFWEHSNASAVAVSKNMALLFAFVRWAPLRLYVPLVAEIVHLVDQKILELVPACVKKPNKPNCFSRLLLQHVHIEENVRATEEDTTLAFGLKSVLQVASQTVLWLYSRETCHWIRMFFRQNAASVLDKKAMRSCFLHFLQDLEERLNAEVLAATALRTLSDVAEEVIAVVYSHECFYDRRPLLRQILSGQGFAGWNMFVAQMRDTYISATSLPVSVALLDWNSTFTTAFPPRNAVERSWNGEWDIDMDDVHWDINERKFPAGNKSSAHPRVPDVSLLSLVELISQIVRFEVAVDIRESTLRVRVPQGLAGCIDCMLLVLDGKDRVYRTFPNGLTSCGGDGAFGDYVGKMRFEDPGQLVVYLEIFNWALEQGASSYHVRTNIECHNNGRLSLDGDILETTGSSTITLDKVSCIGEMSLRAKLESVEKGSARRYHATDAPRDAFAASWTEYGTFHLGYRKMSEK